LVEEEPDTKKQCPQTFIKDKAHYAAANESNFTTGPKNATKASASPARG
jgi:hypothetical protein